MIPCLSRLSFSRWFRGLLPSRTVRRPVARRVRLAVEVLEGRAMPSVVTVTSASDDPTDTGSLRYALNNATPGETIDFAANVRTINLSNTLNSTGLTIGVNLSIINDQGVGPVTIDGGGQLTVFTIPDLSVTASLSGITIADGISNRAQISNAGGGGGIYNLGTLTVSNCIFSHNSANGGNNSNNGGGIYNEGTVMVSNSTFSNDTAVSDGSGVYNAGTLVVTTSMFLNNSVDIGDGGGIDNVGGSQVIVSNSTFSNNSTTNGSGGGISSFGTLTVNNSTFFNNTANGNTGGGIYCNNGTLTIYSSTFTNNSATQGGGIDTGGALTVIKDCTISDNFANGEIDTPESLGGGIYAFDNDPTTVTLNGDIVSGNADSATNSRPDDIAGLVALSSSDNLTGIGGSGGLIDGLNGNQVGVSVANVGLGALGNNGGPTETIAIGPASLAIGTGYTETTATTDQRGVGRPIGQPSDVGAYQYSVTPTVTSNPTNQAIIVGQDTSFSATASDGSPTPTNVQWQVSTDGGDTFTNVNSSSVFSGVTSPTLAITSAASSLTGDEFRAVFSNAAGLNATTRAATLTVEVPFSIVTITGAAQSETVGTVFAPLEAFVSDAQGAPVSGANVTFSIVAGNGGASGVFTGNTTVTTNAYGMAIAPALTAGHTIGTFTVMASVSGVATPAVFDLTNTPGAPATITAVGGAAQNTVIGSLFGTALQAKVVDAYGNPLAGVPVTFSAPSTGPSGSFHALTTVPTNALGIATAPAISANHVTGSFTVTATVAGVATPADFTLTNTGIPAAIRVVAGSGQHASVTSAYATPLQARVTDASGNPVSGITVVFELPGGAANGTFSGSTAVVTNANGVATAPTLTANTMAGSFTVSAWVARVAMPANFALTNVPLGPNAVSVFAGSGQIAGSGRAYATSLQALVVDQYGNPVSGARVTFTAPTSGASGTFGSASTITSVTGANGIATVAITANNTAGSFHVTAAVPNVSTPATFNLTNSPIHAISVVSGTPQNARVNTAYGTALKVKVVNAAGNPLAGISITFHAPSSGASGTFSGSVTVLTGQNGIATAPPFTANGVVGSFTVTASLTTPIGGITPAMFNLKNTLLGPGWPDF